MRTKILALGLVFLLLSNCMMMMKIPTFYWIAYEISLEKVERPAEAKKRYGEQKVFKIEEEDFKYAFEDEMIKIAWLPSAVKIAFIIENKTDYSIRIIWDEAAYVDENGESHRIMHSGVRYINRDSPKPPSVIVRRGKLTDVIIPSDYVISGPSGWEEKPLFPNKQVGGDVQELLSKAEKYIGKTIQILLPIQIENTTNDYIFIFKVLHFELIEK